jgi:hypothetical protein
MDPIEAFLAARTFRCPTMHVRMTPEACVKRQNRPPDGPTTRPDLTQHYFDARCREQRCTVGRANAKRLGIPLVKPAAPPPEPPDPELLALLCDEARDDEAGAAGRRDR